MFEWKVEDLMLRKETSFSNLGRGYSCSYVFGCERTLPAEEKIAFVDSMQDGVLSYALDVAKKYENDKSILPKDKHGKVLAVSLKAWLKRNDPRKVFDDRYNYGHARICGLNTYVMNINSKGMHWVHDNLVDEAFHEQLAACLRLENEYFNTHDKYSVLKSEFLNKSKQMGTTFGVCIIHNSDGDVFISKSDDYTTCRPITIPELEDLLDKYERVEQLISNLSQETRIAY